MQKQPLMRAGIFALLLAIPLFSPLLALAETKKLEGYLSKELIGVAFSTTQKQWNDYIQGRADALSEHGGISTTTAPDGTKILVIAHPDGTIKQTFEPYYPGYNKNKKPESVMVKIITKGMERDDATIQEIIKQDQLKMGVEYRVAGKFKRSGPQTEVSYSIFQRSGFLLKPIIEFTFSHPKIEWEQNVTKMKGTKGKFDIAVETDADGNKLLVFTVPDKVRTQIQPYYEDEAAQPSKIKVIHSIFYPESPDSTRRPGKVNSMDLVAEMAIEVDKAKMKPEFNVTAQHSRNGNNSNIVYWIERAPKN